jgi:hypothetical protein
MPARPLSRAMRYPVQTIDSGCAIQPNVLSNAECDALIDALSRESVQRTRAGARGLMANPAVAALATAPD